VFCDFHYSTRFATKCTGCNWAILEQFVEIITNSHDERWHRECYMVYKVRRSSPHELVSREQLLVLERESGLSATDLIHIFHRRWTQSCNSQTRLVC